MTKVTRRKAAKLIGASSGALLFPMSASRLFGSTESLPMLTREIPSSGEQLPVIGLGTWNTFDVDLRTADQQQAAQLAEVLRRFSDLGGRLIDSSPMYGRAEEVIGELTTKLGLQPKLFLATKVWTRGKEAGAKSMERSLALMHSKRLDLMQVHNLVDVDTQLAIMRDWKGRGRFRYIGITHYKARAFSEVEKVLRSEKLDFLQLNYSIMERKAEERILPLAQDQRGGVIINRPFGGRHLLSLARAQPRAHWAYEFNSSAAGEAFLNWTAAS